MCIYTNGMSIESAVHFGAPRIKKHAPSTRGKGPRACNRTDISLIMNAPISRSSTDIFSKRTKNCAVVSSKTSAPRQGAQKYEGQKILSFILFTLPWYLSSLNYWRNDEKDGWFLLQSEDRLLMFELGLLKIHYFFCTINQRGQRRPFLEWFGNVSRIIELTEFRLCWIMLTEKFGIVGVILWYQSIKVLIHWNIGEILLSTAK